MNEMKVNAGDWNFVFLIKGLQFILAAGWA